jgi:glutamate synthase (ferredoxin)
MDMVIELLLMTGRSLPEVMMMVVPEAWEKHKPCLMTKKHSTSIMLMEPWDGPASIPFTDGNVIGFLTEMVCVPLVIPLPKMDL